ncbi:MAG: hypothetical protein QF823_07935 [Candidatus Marinimicrobia bacterium]|jgi:hypothetical protein|nr:hypothetical protein [Candidatus Neomarinimicrobiota bacterium]MDP6612205.1 hypothetical protein [Candidatus Neomarinimicrobiota bacterium]|tara:strand:- start:413 stop:922 length:510 start_codon:yes stop_codon:yes gene_type:complete
MNSYFNVAAILIIAFVASIYFNEAEKSRIADNLAAAEAAKIARIQAMERESEETARLAEIERAKYKDNVDHDSNPKTDTYKIVMDGKESFDPDKGDKLKFNWVQKSGADVKLSSNTDATVTFSAPTGEYTFALSATDDYGLTTTASKTVKIGPEPNKAPVVILDVRKGK